MNVSCIDSGARTLYFSSTVVVVVVVTTVSVTTLRVRQQQQLQWKRNTRSWHQ